MTFAKYFGFRLRKTALSTVIFSLISSALIINKVADINRHGCSPLKENLSGIVYLAMLIGVAATVIPMLETVSFKQRRNLDTLYSLPIKRWKIALAHYLCGFIRVAFIYSTAFFGNYIWLSQNTDYLNLAPMISYYLLSLCIGLIIYSVFIFIFSRANTVIDGILISALWTLACMIAASAAVWVLLATDMFTLLGLTFNDFWGYSEMGSVYSPLYYVTLRFQRQVEVYREIEFTAFDRIVSYVGWALAGVGSAVGYFYGMTHKGAQEAGEISNTVFGYKLLIPIYGFGLIILHGYMAILSISILAAMAIGYFIMRRSFRLKRTDIVMLGIAVVLAIAVG